MQFIQFISLFFPFSIKFICLFIVYFFAFVIATETDSTGCWTKIQKLSFNTIYNPYGALFIIVCILLNTLCMALDHHDMSRELDTFLRTANYVSINVDYNDDYVYMRWQYTIFFFFPFFPILHSYCCVLCSSALPLDIFIHISFLFGYIE